MSRTTYNKTGQERVTFILNAIEEHATEHLPEGVLIELMDHLKYLYDSHSTLDTLRTPQPQPQRTQRTSTVRTTTVRTQRTQRTSTLTPGLLSLFDGF